MDPTAKIGVDCLIGPDVSIGAGCTIGDGVRLSNCVIMTGVSIKQHSKVDNCIIGWESRIGAWARIENSCVLGKDVEVKVGGVGVVGVLIQTGLPVCAASAAAAAEWPRFCVAPLLGTGMHGYAVWPGCIACIEPSHMRTGMPVMPGHDDLQEHR